MNITYIGLGIVLIIVFYFLYAWLTGSTSSVISSNTYLGSGSPPVSMTTLSNPGSTRYAYSAWYFVNSLMASGNTTLFSVTGPSSPQFTLYITTSGVLQADVLVGTTTNTYTIAPNFPLQKWEYVVISVDNSLMDIYLEGKLIKSYQLSSSPAIPTATSTITFGQIDAYVSNFKRLPNPMDPTTAWTTYMAGNGSSSILNTFSKFGVNVDLTKDNVVQKTVSIF